MREFVRALIVFVVMSLLTGVAYPLVVTGLSQLVFPEKAQGSLVRAGGKTVGSSLIGQQFTSPKYFHSRPSALERPYDAGNSGGSNSGPSNRKFLEEVAGRIDKVRRENGLEPTASVPADMVLASGSGLDPHISFEAARIQVKRVAQARGLPEEAVKGVMQGLVETPLFGFIGQGRINVLRLNLTLDGLHVSRLRLDGHPSGCGEG
jgi:potassium-transporting ATPase KdpC subunit